MRQCVSADTSNTNTITQLHNNAIKTYHIFNLYGGWHLKQTAWFQLHADGVMPAGSAFLASLGTGYVYDNMIAVRCGAHICTNDIVLPSYFSAGIYFKSANFDIGAAWLSAANTYSISARLKL